MQILIATHNVGKVRELTTILQGLGLTPVSLDEVGIAHDVAETGDTFRQNAVLKAIAYARLSSRLTLADDSGLEVDALDGAPGVYTKRFGGANLSQAQRNALLLDTLRDVSPGQRGARFRCVTALAGSDGTVLAVTEGVCEGVIASAPAGEQGFGYDPVFYLPAQGVTMAQLTAVEKEIISHRGRALRAMAPMLVQAAQRFQE